MTAPAAEGATHALTEYGTTNCPVEGVRANVDDGECSACGAHVAGSGASPARDGDTLAAYYARLDRESQSAAENERDDALAEVERLRAENDRVGDWIDDYKREQERIIGRYMDRLAEVAARHQPYPLDDRTLCRHCGREWPCADAVTAGGAQP